MAGYCRWGRRFGFEGRIQKNVHDETARDARLPYPVLFPSPGLSTDNAAMIAAAAFPRLARGEFDDFTLPARANLALA